MILRKYKSELKRKYKNLEFYIFNSIYKYKNLIEISI